MAEEGLSKKKEISLVALALLVYLVFFAMANLPKEPPIVDNVLKCDEAMKGFPKPMCTGYWELINSKCNWICIQNVVDGGITVGSPSLVFGYHYSVGVVGNRYQIVQGFKNHTDSVIDAIVKVKVYHSTTNAVVKDWTFRVQFPANKEKIIDYHDIGGSPVVFEGLTPYTRTLRIKTEIYTFQDKLIGSREEVVTG